MFKHLVICVLALLAVTASATHNRSGEIIYKRIQPFYNANGQPVYTYSFTLIKYTDHGPGIADRCDDTLYFGDGSKDAAPRFNGGGLLCGGGGCSPGCGQLVVNNPSYMVKKSMYGFVHTYPGPGTYTVSNADPNRTAGVHNIPNSDLTLFYIESVVVADAFVGDNTSPIPDNAPMDIAILGKCYYHSLCAYDMDGDSLSYELIPCKSGLNTDVPGYFFPETGASGSYSIDPMTGLLSWCTPQIVGTYNIAIRVKEWRKQGCTGPYQFLGAITRDMQVLTQSAPNAPTYTIAYSGSQTICAAVGDTFLKTYTTTVSAGGPSSYGFWTSGEILYPYSPTVTIYPGNVSTITGYSSCQNLRTRPYDIDVIVRGNNVLGQVKYQRLYLKIIPPAPVMHSVQIDTSMVTLRWKKPVCTSGLVEYRIYRKIGPNSWAHGDCETGVPSSSGFQLIDSRPPSDTVFKDVYLWNVPNGSLGNYIVTSVWNDCAESFAGITQTVSLVVGLKEENAAYHNARIYPNPFSDQLNVDLGESYSGSVQAALFASDGKQVAGQAGTAVQGSLNLALPSLAPGIYLLELRTEKGLLHRKLARE